MNCIFSVTINRRSVLRDAAKLSLLSLLLFTFSIQLSFCQQPDSSWNRFEIIPQPQKNFTVYKIRPQIFLIQEAACFEDVNCYLFIGKKRCLLFDSGLGTGDIKKVIDGLTHYPVVVVNSHTHYDHINGNYLFKSIAGLNNDFTKTNAKGTAHEAMVSFYRKAYMVADSITPCLPPGYFIHPFSLNKFVADKEKIELGGITLEVLNTPGHTPDGICLLDRKDSLLFSGDLIYKGTLFLHLPESNFKDYTNSIARLNAMRVAVKNIMPAHGPVNLDVVCISNLAENIREIKDGKISFIDINGIHLFKFPFFKFLIKQR